MFSAPQVRPPGPCSSSTRGPRSWLPLLLLTCGLALGCGGDDDDSKTPAGGADSEAAEECIPADQCCKVCGDSQPCGDSCIAADLECSQEPGCACDASLVCEEDSGESD